MKQQDVLQVAQLEEQLFSDGWSEKSIQESLDHELVYMIVSEYSGKEASEICGYLIVYMAADEGDIARIAVDRDFRNQGIADRMLQRLWEHCDKNEINRILLEVRESNESAIKLYEKHGFSVLGKRKRYYTNPLEDGVMMEKILESR